MTERRVPTLRLMEFINGDEKGQQEFVDGIMTGLKEYGFIILEDHPVGQDKVNKFYEYVNEFFNLPIEVKNKYCKEELKKQRGYIPFGLEQAVGFKHPDLKEFWHTGRELTEGHKFKETYPDNVWPEEIPEFKELAIELYTAMDQTAKVLLTAIGRGLGLDDDFFANMIKDGNSIHRLIHYPKVKGLDTKNAVRAAAHGDINLITLLVGATNSGLQLLDRDDTWLDVDSKPGQIVVDTGDMMSRLTNDVLPSTIHRVINPDDSDSVRFSMPFFVHPHPEARLDCLPSCVGEEGPKYSPITSQEFLEQRLKDIGLM